MVQAPPAYLDGYVVRSFINRTMAAAGSLDVTPTSWYRSISDNARVGGDPFSQHLVGWAIDAVGPDQQMFAKRLRLSGITTVQEASHLHFQAFPAGVLRRLLGSV